jgi:hypothetical protein
MALQNRQTDEDLAIIAVAMVGAAVVAAGVSAAVAWLLSRRAHTPAEQRDLFDDVPWDGEPLTADELARIAQSEGEIAHGDVFSWEEVVQGRQARA